MIIKQASLFERFNRAMPFIGVLFFIYQSRKSIDRAKTEDLDYIRGMEYLNTKPNELLLKNSEHQEWVLIISILISLITVWIFSFLFFKESIDIRVLFGLTSIIGMIVDYIIGVISLKAFTKYTKFRVSNIKL